jgi:hypothetical protein
VAGTVAVMRLDLLSSILMSVRAGALADLEVVAVLLATMRRPWISIAAVDLAVTAPKALENLLARAGPPEPPPWKPEPPPLGKVRPPAPGPLVLAVHAVADFDVVATTDRLLATKVDVPFAVPVALTQAPTATSVRVNVLLREILVAEVITTDVWPEVPCTSRVDPLTWAIFPEANDSADCVLGAAAAAVPGRPTAAAPRTTSAAHVALRNTLPSTTLHPKRTHVCPA